MPDPLLKDAYTLELCPHCGERALWLERPNNPHNFGWHCPVTNEGINPVTILVEPIALEFERLGRKAGPPPLSDHSHPH